MKRSILFIALLAIVVMAGCSGSSPSARPVPTVVPESWAITELTASASQVYVGVPVQIDVAVTQNGAPAPDGTTVQLLSSGPGTLYGFTSGDLVPSKGELNHCQGRNLEKQKQKSRQGAAASVQVPSSAPSRPYRASLR